MDKIEAQAVEMLVANSNLMALLKESPRARLIPFMGSRQSFYLLVSLLVSKGNECGEDLPLICKETAKSIIESGDVDHLPGLKIALYEERESIKCFLRVFILREAFIEACHLDWKDVLYANESLSVGLYIARPLR